jgi:hypothetical protein
VPEAAVNKDRGAETGEHQIRAAWEATIVQPKPETPTVQTAPQQQFGFRVLAANATHVEPPLLYGQYIGHGLLKDRTSGVAVRMEQSEIRSVQRRKPGTLEVPERCSYERPFGSELLAEGSAGA